MDGVIQELIVKDIRFPTSLEKHGSDAMVNTFCARKILISFLFL